MKYKKILPCTLTISFLVVGILCVFAAELSKRNENTKGLEFDFGLIDRLNDALANDTPSDIGNSDYSKENITHTMWDLESITYFLPDDNNFQKASSYIFNEKRRSFDVASKIVYELYFHFEYFSSYECDEIWHETGELTYGNHGKPTCVEDLFEFPAIVFSYNYGTCFQYALRTSDCSIAFIAFDSIESANNLVFDESYRPSKTLYESSFPNTLIGKDGSYSC